MIPAPEFDSRFRRRHFSRLSYTSDFKIGTPVATLPGAWCYRISAGTGRPGVSTLWLGEISATSISVWQHVQMCKQIRPWVTQACCWDVKQPTNNHHPGIRSVRDQHIITTEHSDCWQNCVTPATWNTVFVLAQLSAGLLNGQASGNLSIQFTSWRRPALFYSSVFAPSSRPERVRLPSAGEADSSLSDDEIPRTWHLQHDPLAFCTCRDDFMSLPCSYEIQRNKKAERYTDRQTDREVRRKTDRRTCKYTDRYRQITAQVGRQQDRKTKCW